MLSKLSYLNSNWVILTQHWTTRPRTFSWLLRGHKMHLLDLMGLFTECNGRFPYPFIYMKPEPRPDSRMNTDWFRTRAPKHKLFRGWREREEGMGGLEACFLGSFLDLTWPIPFSSDEALQIGRFMRTIYVSIMKNLTNFHKTVETGVDPQLVPFLSRAAPYRPLYRVPQGCNLELWVFLLRLEWDGKSIAGLATPNNRSPVTGNLYTLVKGKGVGENPGNEVGQSFFTKEMKRKQASDLDLLPLTEIFNSLKSSFQQYI